jgi:hypothetical protein
MIETITNRAAAEINGQPTPERLQNIAEWAFKRCKTMGTIKAEVGTLLAQVLADGGRRGRGSLPQPPRQPSLGNTGAKPRPRGDIGASTSQSLQDYQAGISRNRRPS